MSRKKGNPSFHLATFCVTDAPAAAEKCVFAIGLTKLAQEYAEFQGRRIEQFMLEVPPQDQPDKKAHDEKKNVNDYTEDELLRGWDLTIFMTHSPKE